MSRWARGQRTWYEMRRISDPRRWPNKDATNSVRNSPMRSKPQCGAMARNVPGWMAARSEGTMIFRYVDHLRSKRYTVAVPDGSTIRDTPAGQVVTLPRAGLLPSLTFLSIPKFA